MGISGGGVVAGQATNGTNASATTPDGQLGQLNGSNDTDTDSNQTTPLDASNQRNQTGAIGGASGGLTGGNVSASIQGNGSSTTSGSSGGGLFGFSMKKDVIRPTMNSTRTMLANGTVWMLNQSLETTVGTPVPQDDNDDGIVFVPTNDPWQGLYNDFFIPYIFPLATVLALLGMIIECGIMPWEALRNPTYSQTRAFVTFVLTLVAIVFTMPIITVMHAFVDVLATNVAPDAAELIQSTKGLMNLGAGSILGIVTAYAVGYTEVLILAFIYALRYGALFILPWFLPLLIALAYNAPHDRLSNLSSELLWQYIGLLIQAVPVAFLFRGAYEMEWDFGIGGLMGLLASAAIFLVAAALPIVTSIGMFKAAPSVQSVASGAAGYVAGSSASDYARQAPGQAARGGYQRMANVKTSIKERVASLTETDEDGDPYRNGIPASGEL
ncbi:hypothetical protein [Halococcus sediminicola]|uniref:hypothetical protein n=1 Tax=Halococcus sediminicola TaxID=1264579 RepID=UPI000679A2F8|nr:hypothetical protein [Halococcus sediminicola]